MTRVEPPPTDRSGVVTWVGTHLGDLFEGDLAASPSFRGGQGAADTAIAAFDVTGYAAQRNEVLPESDRGASQLSPYIRHGLLTLPRVWSAVSGGPPKDVAKFRDELLWQEYARHVYARLGRATASGLRHRLDGSSPDEPWPRAMACVDTTLDELETDGWLVNQTRMWLASQWSVRSGARWQEGEDRFFTHLLDGSRAANRLGWQWTVGTGTGRAYGFSRSQVERRAPGLCTSCTLTDTCPIEAWPDDPPLVPVDEHPALRGDPEPGRTGGPATVESHGTAEAVWITAESLGDEDPALSAHPDLPAIFVFDEPLLRRLRLSSKRLVFLAECVGDLASRRPIEVHRGRPRSVLAGRPVAVTFTPVPGWRAIADHLRPIEVHPWPWLRRPHGGSAASFSAWRRATERAGSART